MQHNGKKKLDWINEKTAEGYSILLQTYLKTTEVTARTLAIFENCGGLFKVDKNDSLYIRRGKHWDCVDYCKISAI